MKLSKHVIIIPYPYHKWWPKSLLGLKVFVWHNSTWLRFFPHVLHLIQQNAVLPLLQTSVRQEIPQTSSKSVYPHLRRKLTSHHSALYGWTNIQLNLKRESLFLSFPIRFSSQLSGKKKQFTYLTFSYNMSHNIVFSFQQLLFLMCSLKQGKSELRHDQKGIGCKSGGQTDL